MHKTGSTYLRFRKCQPEKNQYIRHPSKHFRLGKCTARRQIDRGAGTPESFRKLIQNERRIEFAFENQRFWDLRRWLLPLNESILGMEVTRKEDSSENFEVKLVEERPLNDIRYYYLPLPYDELQKNPNLKNNKGW